MTGIDSAAEWVLEHPGDEYVEIRAEIIAAELRDLERVSWPTPKPKSPEYPPLWLRIMAALCWLLAVAAILMYWRPDGVLR